MDCRSLRVASVCILLGLSYLTLSSSVRAEPPARSEEFAWHPAWPKFRASEYVLTGVTGLASLGAFFLLKAPSTPHWTGGILLDDTLRDALRLRSPHSRDRARALSDVTAITSVLVVVGVDSLAVPLLRNKPEIAQQQLLLDAESFAISSLITTTMFKIIGRGRPSYQACQHDPSFDPLCRSGDTASFPSGHTNAAFTAAGLSCAHHLHLALYGSPLADTLACVGEIALAGATGGLRVVGDRHYATDVWTGAIIGFGVGYGTPTLLHYRKAARAPQASLAMQPIEAGFAGPTISGTF
jgi:membrane-associated phospholipid phosphatase